MTAYERQKIEQALAETKRFIAKEAPRNADTRPADMKQHLDFCIGHAAKLQGMLDNNSLEG